MDQLITDKPKVSIVTVVFNAEKTLEETIQSIIGQSYQNIELIIVDGKSTDSTTDIIKKYESHICKWISEPDRGLYDAMNKGIDLATGDYLWFMNAGDKVYQPDLLEKIFSQNPSADFYYGETMLIDGDGKEIGIRSEHTSQKLPTEMSWKSLNKGLVVGHQSVIVKKSVAPSYNINYRYSADIDWIIRCLKNSRNIVNTGMIISAFLSNPVLGKFQAGGESKKHLFKSLAERFSIFRSHYGLGATLYNHLLILVKAMLFVIRKSF